MLPATPFRNFDCVTKLKDPNDLAKLAESLYIEFLCIIVGKDGGNRDAICTFDEIAGRLILDSSLPDFSKLSYAR